MFAVIVLVVHQKNGAPDALLTNVLPGTVVVAGFLSFFLQLARSRVIAAQSALIVIHPVRRYVFPWGQVADVGVGRDGGLGVQLRDGQLFAVYCFGGSVIGMLTGGIRARKARDGIKAVREAALGQGPCDGPVTSSVDLRWKMMLVFWAVLAAFGFGGWLAPHHVLA
jgi:hypothetical protein